MIVNSKPQNKIVGLDYRIPFGKYRGMMISTIVISDPAYIVWLNEHTTIKIEASIVSACQEASDEERDFDIESAFCDYMAESYGDR